MKLEMLKKFSPVNIESKKSLGIRSGDTVRVHMKIIEKNKSRIQIFEGLVLATRHGQEPGATFIVRKNSKGYGIERIFALYSPLIDKIEIVRRSKVRRAKLYNIREKVQREIKKQIRRKINFSMSTISETQEFKRKELEEKERQIAEEKRIKEAEERAKMKEAEEKAKMAEAQKDAEKSQGEVASNQEESKAEGQSGNSAESKAGVADNQEEIKAEAVETPKKAEATDNQNQEESKKAD